MDWQRQNFKKGGSEPAPSQMNPKIQTGPSQMHSKIAAPTHGMGGLVSSGMPEPLKMANGGLIAGLAAGLGAAYLYNKNKDKEVGVGFKQTGESEMRSAQSDADKKDAISGGMKPKAEEVESSFTDNMPAKASVEESKPINSGSSYTGDIGNADNNPASTVKSALKKTAARPVASKPINVSSGASGFSTTAKDEAPSKPTPVRSKENEGRPTKPYPDVVDRSIRSEAKSGVKTVYEDKPFSFQKKNEEDRAAAAKDAADREAKARSRKVGSDIRYNEAGDAY